MTNGWRSVLFAPASEPRKAAKAVASAADQVALDLEAAVPDDHKESARQTLSEQLPGYARKPLVRVNDLASETGQDDLAMLDVRHIAGLIVPLIGSAKDLERASEQLEQRECACGTTPLALVLVVVIETCRGLVNVAQIAGAAGARPLRLSFGAWDFTLDSGVAYTKDEAGLAWARQQVVVHARAAGLPAALDASYPYLDDHEGYEASCCRARALGMGGKACIHPLQVEPANRIFSPSEQEIERATALVKAYEEAKQQAKAAIRFRGEFVDRPMYEQAKRVLKLAQ